VTIRITAYDNKGHYLFRSHAELSEVLVQSEGADALDPVNLPMRMFAENTDVASLTITNELGRPLYYYYRNETDWNMVWSLDLNSGEENWTGQDCRNYKH
jgi:hypothetical protein